jgi:hypothetical protein
VCQDIIGHVPFRAIRLRSNRGAGKDMLRYEPPFLNSDSTGLGLVCQRGSKSANQGKCLSHTAKIITSASADIKTLPGLNIGEESDPIADAS